MHNVIDIKISTYLNPPVNDDTIPRLVRVARRRRVAQEVKADARVDKGECDDGNEEGRREEKNGVHLGTHIRPRLYALVVGRPVVLKGRNVHVEVKG